MLKHKKYCKFIYVALLCLICGSYAQAEDFKAEPPTLEYVKDIDTDKSNTVEDNPDALEMRLDALKEAALSYGALSGLIHRNWEIFHIVEKKEIVLDAIFNFSRLMIPAHYGTLIEPPIISESENAFLLGDGGMSASITSKIYSIGENAKIVSSSRNWREYLLNHIDLTVAEKPDQILRPRTSKEKDLWEEYVEKGWREGVEQANDIFEDSLALLVADYVGMVRYRKLLAQKMISEPFAVKENKGVTGGGDEMRIDDKAVIITSIPSLNRSSDSWEPTER